MWFLIGGKILSYDLSRFVGLSIGEPADSLFEIDVEFMLAVPRLGVKSYCLVEIFGVSSLLSIGTSYLNLVNGLSTFLSAENLNGLFRYDISTTPLLSKLAVGDLDFANYRNGESPNPGLRGSRNLERARDNSSSDGGKGGGYLSVCCDFTDFRPIKC